MSRTSRIPRRPGSLFVAIYHEDVARFGLAGAAVLGLLDFLDRAQSVEEQPLASRLRIMDHLQGIVGKHSVDGALRSLLEAGVIKAHKKTIIGPRNLQTTVTYGFDLSGFARFMGRTETPVSGTAGNPHNRERGQFPEPGPELGPETGVPSINKKNLEAAECTTPFTAASTVNQKRRTERPSGIVTWTVDDTPEAERIEQKHTPEEIEAAVAALAVVGKEPVPGLVAREIAQQKRKAEQQATNRAAYQALLNGTQEQSGRSPADVAAARRCISEAKQLLVAKQHE